MTEKSPPTPRDLAQKFGYAEYMVERYIQLFGLEETLQLLRANEIPLPVTIRTNTLKITPKTLNKRLEDKGFEIRPVQELPYAFEVGKGPYSIGATHEYMFGFYFLQGIASMIPVELLDPRPGDMVIDMCAAPGGKSTHIAQKMQNKGTLYVIEWNEVRMPALTTNLARCGVHNHLVFNMDAKKFGSYGIQANKILLDAPCTGEGTIRSDPSRKKSRTMKDVLTCSNTQKDLIAAAIKLLRPGGELVYSTCSIAPEENEVVVQSALDAFSNVSVVEVPRILQARPGLGDKAALHRALRYYPHVHNTEGFFVCKLKKR